MHIFFAVEYVSCQLSQCALSNVLIWFVGSACYNLYGQFRITSFIQTEFLFGCEIRFAVPSCPTLYGVVRLVHRAEENVLVAFPNFINTRSTVGDEERQERSGCRLTKLEQKRTCENCWEQEGR
jgi:hypothetical protein